MTVNIGAIGVGLIGQDHIRRISEVLSGGRVSAVCDVDALRAAEVAAARGAAVAPDAAALIARHDVDAVLVASWGPAHEEAVLAAITAGKPVFCEKPLTPTTAGCQRIVAAEVAAGRRLVQVGFMRRYDASYRALKAVHDGGALGAALLVHCAHRNPTVPESYTADMAINDTAVHEIDTMRWLLGEEIVAARVDRGKPTSLRFPHLADPIILILETASGVRIDAEVFVNARYGYDIRCELVAERGTAALGDQHRIVLRDGEGDRHRIAGDWRERFLAAYDTELQEWIDSVAAGAATGPSAWDGYAVAAACDAGVASLLDPDGARVVIELGAKPDLYA
jgi:myo-inositol 2-dehydrogenase/D-chiro-inositol 1-dehydrogenase